MELTGKRALVTGADGFIGSHLVETLVESGCKVRALAQYNSFNHWGWLESIDCLGDIEVITGDVRDAECCRQLTTDIDVVFNLAALIAIPYSYRAPQSYIDTNINGALNICQAALHNGVARVIQVSTSEVYGTAQYVPIDEAHPLQPQSPYSASKIGADAIAMSHFHAYELPVIVARPFNTYGPRQSNRAVIPTVITQLAAGATILNLGDLSPTRDFNYVLDTCGGLVSLATADAATGATVNIGSNSEISIADTVAMIQDLMGTDAHIKTDEQRLRPGGSEVFRLWCENARLHELTGFKPANDLRAGLQATIEWFRDEANLARYKTTTYNV